MRNWWFYLGMFATVTVMELTVKSICVLNKLPIEAAVAIGVGSGVVATLGYILAKHEDRDKKDNE